MTGPPAGLEVPAVRPAHGIAVWTLLGLLLGAIPTGAVLFGQTLATGTYDEMLDVAPFVLGTELAGVLLGVLLGIVDLPRRVPGQGATRVLLAGVAALPLGAIAAALAGGAAALLMVSPVLLFDPSWPFYAVAGLSLLAGSTAGMVGATLPVAVFSATRAWTLQSARPWWIAHVIAVAVSLLMAPLALPAARWVLPK